MIKTIIKRFVKEDIHTNDGRAEVIRLSGILGILCNTMIFSFKLGLGLWVNSIAIISDAFNNLSDIGSSLVSIITAKLSNLPPDDEHPHEDQHSDDQDDNSYLHLPCLPYQEEGLLHPSVIGFLIGCPLDAGEHEERVIEA